jgi:hypothetical protein
MVGLQIGFDRKVLPLAAVQLNAFEKKDTMAMCDDVWMWGSRLVGEIKWALKLPLFFKNSLPFCCLHTKLTPPHRNHDDNKPIQSQTLILHRHPIHTLHSHPLLLLDLLPLSPRTPASITLLPPKWILPLPTLRQYPLALLSIRCRLRHTVSTSRDGSEGEEKVGIDRSGGILLCSFVWAL